MRRVPQKPRATRRTRTTGPAKAGRASSGHNRDGHAVFQLQHRIGNQAVQRLLRFNGEDRELGPLSDASTGVAREPAGTGRQTGVARSVEAAHAPVVQRSVEVRPAGRSKASAFDRREELIERLNRQSAAIQYRLEGRVLQYDIVEEAGLTHFDRQMRDFIDGANVLPLRLISGAGLVDNPSGAFEPLLVDSFVLGYLDLDDMLASDDISFQMRFIHILTERSHSRNYARRIGGNFSLVEFRRVHRAGHEAQAEYLRDLIGDPTIRFVSNERLTGGTVLIMFRSDEGYHVFERFRNPRRRVRGGEVFALTRDRRRLSIDQLVAERAAAAARARP